MLEPMKNTELLYDAIKKFIDARNAARDEYMKTTKALENAKGSAYYIDESRKAKKAREAVVEEARAKAASTIDICIASMRKANSARKMIAPTEEQLRILQALKMLNAPDGLRRNTIPEEQFTAAANAMNGNGIGLSIIQQIARENNCFTNFVSMATDAPSAESTINDLQEACRRILHSDGESRAAKLAADFYNRQHGTALEPDDLPREAPYESEQDFYNRNVSMPYNLFAEAVNGPD